MRAESAAGTARPLISVALGKALVSIAVLASGFRALSDDDFSRLVIAQRFAEAPVLDPSGTSWLPLPFWIYGTAMKLFGATLRVGRSTGFVLGVASALLVFAAARLLGLRPWLAAAAALLASVIPWNAYLGVATVPEAPAAALCLFGAAALGATDAKSRLFGAGALALACASRYEPWPIAALFTAWSSIDAVRLRSARLAIAAGLAAVVPLLWLSHGALHHGDAAFFVQRVTAYQSALGGENESFLRRLLFFPRAAISAEPEICVLTGLAVVAAIRAKMQADLRSLTRPALAMAALLAFLMVGTVRGSSATHHAERALLPLWLFGAVVVVALLPKALATLEVKWRVAVGAATLALALVVTQFRATLGPGGGSERLAEIDIGEFARLRRANRIAIDTPDFGFYAVSAAFGVPSRALPLDDHDPRRARRPNAFASEKSLALRLAELEAGWLVTTRARARLTARLGRAVYENSKFVLIELER